MSDWCRVTLNVTAYPAAIGVHSYEQHAAHAGACAIFGGTEMMSRSPSACQTTSTMTGVRTCCVVTPRKAQTVASGDTADSKTALTEHMPGR